MEHCVEEFSLKLTMSFYQGKDVSYMKQPAAGLVKLALHRWQLRGMRADNISAIVVILDSADSDTQPAATTSKCHDHVLSPKNVLRRVRVHPRRSGLRTVLGRICRLRAQRKFGNISLVRSPLQCYNRLSEVLRQHTTSGEEVSLRRPLRRSSYREACSNVADNDVDKMPIPKVVLRRLSVDVGHGCVITNKGAGNIAETRTVTSFSNDNILAKAGSSLKSSEISEDSSSPRSFEMSEDGLSLASSKNAVDGDNADELFRDHPSLQSSELFNNSTSLRSLDQYMEDSCVAGVENTSTEAVRMEEDFGDLDNYQPEPVPLCKTTKTDTRPSESSWDISDAEAGAAVEPTPGDDSGWDDISCWQSMVGLSSPSSVVVELAAEVQCVSA